jgi:hypothetical protein
LCWEGTFAVEGSLMEECLKVREDRVRCALIKRGYLLRKTPARSWLRQHYGPGYMIIEADRNLVVSGYRRRAYEDDIEHAEWFAFERPPAEETAA